MGSNELCLEGDGARSIRTEASMGKVECLVEG